MSAPPRVIATLFAVSFLFGPSSVSGKTSVLFTSPCTCEGNHGVARWDAKTEHDQLPVSTGIQPITPAEICAWEGPGQRIRNGRLPSEQKWYALECRIENVKVEGDGDLHIEVKNADGLPGIVVVEVPLGETWCEIRKAAFAWTNAKFPGKGGQFKTVQHPVVRIIGKAFYDTDHAGADTQKNQRGQSSVSVWEIHPVMEIRIGERAVKASPLGEMDTPTSQLLTSPPALPTEAPKQAVEQRFVTITQAVTIKIPYGTTRIPPGTAVKVVRETLESVDVEYLGSTYSIPRTDIAGSHP